MKIGLLTTRLFDEPRNGGEICTARLLHTIVDAGHDALVIGRGPVPSPGMRGARYRSVGPLVEPFESLSARRRVGSLCTALLTRQASTVQRLAEGATPRRVKQELQAESGMDVLIADHLQVLPWVLGPGRKLPALLVVMHNVESDNYAEWARRAGQRGDWLRQRILQREARLLHRLECEALRRAEVLACLSRGDADRLLATARTCGGRAQVEVLPSFPLDTGLQSQAGSGEGPDRRIGMIGTWTWEPNRLGLQWMLDHVLPRLPPACVLVLAGPGLEGLELPRGVVWLGSVARALDFYRSVDVVALSSHVGTGVQEKAVEAIAAARLVVATPHSLRGLRADLPSHVRVTDDAGQFARLCADAPLGADPAWSGSVKTWREARRVRYADVLGRCLATAH